MNLRRDFIKIPLASALAGALTLAALPSTAQQPVTLLNASYDPTRGWSGAQPSDAEPFYRLARG